MPFNLEDRFIDAAEADLATRFPTSYRAAMRQQNGGVLSSEDDDWELYPIADTSDRKRMARTCNSVVRETRAAQAAWPDFPEGAVAVGSNGGGCLLVFLREGAEGSALGPALFSWRHEHEPEPVADDFSELGDE